MTKKEFAQFAMALKTYFPRENVLPNDMAMELWFNELQDLDYKLLETALRKHVQTSKWTPSIAELRSSCQELQNGKSNDYGEGWEIVKRAVRKFGMYNVSEAERYIETYDKTAAEAVKRLGFYEICTSENQIADRANFRMIYEQLQERKKEEKTISPTLQLMMDNVLLQLENREKPIFIESKKEERKEVERPDAQNINRYMKEIKEILHI